jgi:molybdenum cofactor biosynthesis protein MoaC
MSDDVRARRVDYLRLSITDRCNLRCTYCMPAQGVTARDHDDILRFEEIVAFARVAVTCGISKVRITGGEPLVRAGCAELVRMLAALPGVHDLSLTTNGVLLPRFAADLRAAGLRRVNVSLDSLDPARFAAVTRGGRLDDALAGLEAAFAAGFDPVKLNVLLLEGIEDELDAYVRLTLERPLHVRFIEFMPLDRRLVHDGRMVPAPLVLERLRGRHVLGALLVGARRAGHARVHRRRLRPLLRELQPAASHGRRPPAHLSLLGRGGRRAAPSRRRGAAARRRAGGARRQELRPLSRDARQRARDVADRGVSRVSDLSHLDARGRARMVDVGGKDETERRAVAEALVTMAPETLAVIEDEAVPKGDVVAAARLAGVMAAKRTHELIPLCHPLALTFVGVEVESDERLPGLRIVAEARLRGRTGVEMEALVAASVAALTVYDMCKAIDRAMEVGPVRLLEKSGGRSGHWRRDDGSAEAPA